MLALLSLATGLSIGYVLGNKIPIHKPEKEIQYVPMGAPGLIRDPHKRIIPEHPPTP